MGFSYFSHFWLATVQDVLQADWQEAWHSPQPPLAAVSFRLALLMVLTCFMDKSSLLMFPASMDLAAPVNPKDVADHGAGNVDDILVQEQYADFVPHQEQFAEKGQQKQNGPTDKAVKVILSSRQ